MKYKASPIETELFSKKGLKSVNNNVFLHESNAIIWHNKKEEDLTGESPQEIIEKIQNLSNIYYSRIFLKHLSFGENRKCVFFLLPNHGKYIYKDIYIFEELE